MTTCWKWARPGLTTDVLRTRVTRLTAVEIHPDLADALAARLAGTNVEVVCADAARTPLAAGRFSGAVCLTMLHHVPSPQAQDAVLAEIFRLLRPGGVLAGQDSLDSPELRALHHDDVYVPVDPPGCEHAWRRPVSRRGVTRTTTPTVPGAGAGCRWHLSSYWSPERTDVMRCVLKPSQCIRPT